MQPIEFEQANLHLVAPDGHPEVVTLPVAAVVAPDGVPMLISCWQPSQQEVEAIAAGKPVWLWVWGQPGSQIPPMALGTDNPFPGSADAVG